MDWDDDRIRLLLRELNVAMSEELPVIEGLDASEGALIDASAG